MNLCIDIGNTFIKYGLFENTELVIAQKLESSFDVFIQDIMKKQTIDAMIVSSVRNSENIDLSELGIDHVFTLTHQSDLPIELNYETPETLGNDRIANAAGAKAQYQEKNCLIIDVGTCMTIDFLSQNGNFEGGIISPGLQMRLNAMHEMTDGLPAIKSADIDQFELIGKTTRGCMISGAMNGMIAEMNQAISSCEKQNSDLRVLMTGGDYLRFENQLKNAIFADPNLVLKGLNEILLHNLR